MDFDSLKETLQNWLSPEESEEVEATADEEETETNPEVTATMKAYHLKTPINPKASKADKFDSLFDDDENEATGASDLPF